MSNKELVSVIIPTYNRAAKLSTAIESVISQQYEPIQLIVVDDGSDDNTKEVLNKYPQAEYVLQVHAGQAAARNNGLKHAKGSLIASLDSDDRWSPDFIARCFAKLQEENLDFVFANWKQEWPDGKSSDFLSGDTFLKPYIKNGKDNWFNLNDAQLRDLYLRACPSPSSSGLIRKSSIVYGWNEQMKIGDDWCLYLDMVLSKKCRAAFTMQQLWSKQINANNIYDGRKRSEVLELLYIKDMQEFMQRCEQLLAKHELRIITRTYVRGLVELAKHYALRDRNLGESFRLMKQSVRINPYFTLLTIPVVLTDGVNRRIKEFRNKSSEKNEIS
jgi:glycosyltransferase involved in cell wall biosynthesis